MSLGVNLPKHSTDKKYAYNQQRPQKSEQERAHKVWYFSQGCFFFKKNPHFCPSRQAAAATPHSWRLINRKTLTRSTICLLWIFFNVIVIIIIILWKLWIKLTLWYLREGIGSFWLPKFHLEFNKIDKLLAIKLPDLIFWEYLKKKRILLSGLLSEEKGWLLPWGNGNN